MTSGPPESMATSTDPLIGIELGNYRVEEKLAEGGMGLIYRAVHTLIGRQAAIKVLSHRYSDDLNMIKRLHREARAVNRIGHPNIVDIFDFGQTPDGRQYFAMEFLQGANLGQIIETDGPLPWAITSQILTQALDAIAAAHDMGIIHRDIKPENIFVHIGDDDAVTTKVLDFGIAKSVGVGPEGEKLTRAGSVMGTPEYIAPEQIRGKNVDGRADLYALGVILYEMVTGRRPYNSDKVMNLLMAHLRDPIPPLGPVAPELGVPDSIIDLIPQAMAKAPENRFQDARTMAQALGLAVSAVMPSDGTRPLPELFWGTDASGATGDVSRVSGVTGPGGFTRPGYAPAPGVAQTQAQLPLAPDPGRRSPLLWILPLAVILLSGATIAAVLALKSSSKKGATPGKVVVAVGSGHGTPTSAPTAVPKSFPPIKNMDDLIFKVRRTLNQGLQSPNPEIRRRAVIGVGELHDKNIKQQLIEFLKTDPQLSVRSTAARSLAKLGDPSVIVDLKAARRTQEPIVRVAIDDALRRLHAPTGKKGLLKALASKNRGVRLAAALALGDAGDTRVRKVLEPMLTANAKITAPVLAALAKTGHKKALASLRKGLETGDAKTKLPYAEALAKLGDDNATAALKKVLTSGELPTRIVAAKNLAALGDYSGLSVLELGISHKAPQTRMLAADAFGAVGDRAALPPLAATLADTVATVKTAAAESLAKVLGLMPNKLLRRSQSWLLAALAQGDWSARNAAVGVTDEMDPELAVEILGWALKDKDARVRVAAVRRLARLAGRSAKARRYVRAHLFNDASPAVRAAAAEGLGAMGDAQAKSDLSRAAGTDKSRTLVGITAAGQLLALGDTRGLKGLLRATKAKHADTRAHAYAALSRWQDAARRRRTLRRGLKDKAAGVRLAAALALASHGQRDGQAVLTKAVEDGGPNSERALRALARLNISQKKHVRTLARSKSASSRRTAMATAITVLGATAALPILRRGARDDDVTVRRAAARGLATLASKQPAVGPLLRRLTRDPDAAIRAAAALGLTKLRHGKVASLKGKAIKKAPEPAEPKLPQKPKKGKKGKQPKLELSFVEDTKKEASYKELIFRAELQLRGGHYPAALRTLSTARRISHNRPPALFETGRVLWKMARQAKEAHKLRRARKHAKAARRYYKLYLRRAPHGKQAARARGGIRDVKRFLKGLR